MDAYTWFVRVFTVNPHNQLDIMTRWGSRLMLTLELLLLSALLQLLRNPHKCEYGRDEPQHVDLQKSHRIHIRGLWLYT